MIIRNRVAARWGAVSLALLVLAGCGSSTADDTSGTDKGPGGGLVTVGFVAVGPEGAWRAANEADVQSTFTEAAGFDLTYAPAQDLDQASQIQAFNAFVDDGVDVILLSATEATGWENSLQRAKDAGIPVILVDRGIDPDNSNLYVTRVAPDNLVVAQSVGEWAVSVADQSEVPLNYYVLEGPTGVGVVDERNRGWDSVVADDTNLFKVGAQTANWSADEGKAVMAAVLEEAGNDIQIVFAQNDEMGLGAALAVEEAGLTPGVDVKIATIDGTVGAMEALADGRLSFVAEYNPLFGKTLLDVVNSVLAGETVAPYIIVRSDTFDSHEAAAAALPNRKY